MPMPVAIRVAITAAIISAIAAPYIFISLLGFVGFGAEGITAGSLAAYIMSTYTNGVAAGSWFATCQSIGAAGFGGFGTTISHVIGGAISLVLFFL
ncbi:hypothetical protein BGX21_001909 [Mortierella sp. AD011]|nr:hypothetical protein BGX21_001909 [Mortierella sp. AD011]